MSQNIKQWWHGLQAREQQFLSIAGVLLVLVLLWAFAWLPYQQAREQLSSRIESRELQFTELSQIALQAKTLRQSRQNGGSGQSDSKREGRSLLRLADETVRAAGLAAALKRIEPASDQQAQVWLENASFDRLIGWLESLEKNYSVRVESANISRPKNSGTGTVNARLGLLDAP